MTYINLQTNIMNMSICSSEMTFQTPGEADVGDYLFLRHLNSLMQSLVGHLQELQAARYQAIIFKQQGFL